MRTEPREGENKHARLVEMQTRRQGVKEPAGSAGQGVLSH